MGLRCPWISGIERLRVVAACGDLTSERLQVVAKKNCLTQCVRAVTVFPLGPDILQAEVSPIPGRFHHLDDPRKIDRVIVESCLQ